MIDRRERIEDGLTRRQEGIRLRKGGKEEEERIAMEKWKELMGKEKNKMVVR